VKPGETAVVAVLIQPPLHPGTPLEQTVANGTGGNGGILSQDGPTFICTSGWDWIPGIRDRDMGIWQKVTLAATGPVVVENPLMSLRTCRCRARTSADLTVEATVHNVTDAPQSGVLSGAFDGAIFPQMSRWRRANRSSSNLLPPTRRNFTSPTRDSGGRTVTASRNFTRCT
jgi:hypothetical protein